MGNDSTVAQGPPPPPLNIARRTVEKTLEWLAADGGVFEICAFNPRVRKNALWQGFVSGKKGIVAGWYNDRAKAADVVGKLDTLETEGIYITLNPCVEAVLARANNRLKAGIDRTTDKEIVRIRTILIDIDPKRPAGVSSTNEEHDFAIEHAKHVAGCLAGAGWPEPLIADSGNGGHLTYHVDLPNIPETVELIKSVLQALNEQHQIHRDGISLEIDTKVFNPARISKVYGTWARKGDDTGTRPHRLTRILSVPNIDRDVSIEQLQALLKDGASACPASKGLVARDPSSGSGNGRRGGRLDLSAYLSRYGIAVRKTKDHGGAELFVLDRCLFDESHSGGEASIGQAADGKLFYQCFHDSCKGRTWADARQAISGADSLASFMEGAGEVHPALPRGALHIDDGAVTSRIQELNTQHAVIMVGGNCHILNEVWDPVFRRKDITFSRVQDFLNYYSNEKVYSIAPSGKPAVTSIGKTWIESAERRQYKGITFAPGGDVPDYYNLYRGFGCEPKEGDWNLFKSHIFDIICGRSQEIYFYVLAWLAHLVQRPGGDKPGTSLVLRGKQGTGKGCFVDNFGKIIGPHFCPVISSEHVTGRFNAHRKDALLIYADEAVWGGDKKAEGVIKGMVTGEFTAIEPKGKDVFHVKNHARLIVSSNEDWVVPAGGDERRFVVLDVKPDRIGDREYFNSVYHQMDNGGREAMLYDLLQVDISGINLKDIPRTEALYDQVTLSMTTVQKFWLERLRAGALTPDSDEWEETVPTSVLYGQYLEFCKNMGDRYPLIDRNFFRELRKMVSPAILYRERTLLSAKRVWVFRFPDIWTCRDNFETYFKIKEEWNVKRY